MSNRLQLSGSNSHNLQCNDLTIIQNNQISYSEIKEISLDIFKSNFLKLSENAAEIATKRAKSFIEHFIIEMISRKEIDPSVMKEPEMQMAFYDAQKEYAKTGDDKIEAILINVLIDKAKENGRTFNSILLNEAVQAVSKLSLNAINTLMIVFLVNSTKNFEFLSINKFIEFLMNYIHPFLIDFKIEIESFRLLEYARCTFFSYDEKIKARHHESQDAFVNVFGNKNKKTSTHLNPVDNFKKQLINNFLAPPAFTDSEWLFAPHMRGLPLHEFGIIDFRKAFGNNKFYHSLIKHSDVDNSKFILNFDFIKNTPEKEDNKLKNILAFVKRYEYTVDDLERMIIGRCPSFKHLFRWQYEGVETQQGISEILKCEITALGNLIAKMLFRINFGDTPIFPISNFMKIPEYDLQWKNHEITNLK